jgi:Raf kinase inhibitor-like YbhB/YbcL family protein
MIMKALTTAASTVALATAVAAAPFTLSSTSFADGNVLAQKHAGNIPNNPNCIGANVSPQLSWSNVPAGTKSLAFVMIDPEGRMGLITNHWVAYGVPVTRTAFAEGEASGPTKGWKAGKTSQGLMTYGGPCTPPDTTWHHYTWVAIATDLEPDALPEGLTREQLFEKLAGHAKGSSGLVGRFRHP